MYVEYNWTSDCYQIRFGTFFTDWEGVRSFPNLDDAKLFFQSRGFKLEKTASRSYEIKKVETAL